MCQHVALYAPGALGMMLQRPRRIAEMMVDEICAFYATERPRGLREIHIVVFHPSMMNDFKTTIQRKYENLQVTVLQNSLTRITKAQLQKFRTE